MSHPTPLDAKTDVTKEAELNRICEKCSRIAHQVMMLQKSCSTDPDNPTVHIIDHHDSSNALITSASDGCHLCTLLLARIDDPMVEDLQVLEAEDRINKRRVDRSAEPSYHVKLSGHLDFRHVSQRHSFSRPIMEAFQFSAFQWRKVERDVSIDIVLPHEVERHEVAGDVHVWSYSAARLYIEHLFDGDLVGSYRQDPAPSTASPSSFAVARQWLHECIEGHPSCRRERGSITSNELPTRLIDVGSLNEPVKCRLSLPNRSFERCEYLALSHKWGGANILKLTKSNFKSMLKGIVIVDLPLTFQHAITITRNLGYQHLWIDSLCIIQDDPGDWAFECSTMSRVYSNSVLTIAALWGDDSHSGCFVERNPFVTEHCRIGTWKHGNVIVRSGNQKRAQPLGLVEPAPLLERAWVLQERFLSPRTLFYGPWELYWECGERTTNESKPENTTVWQGDTLKTRFRHMSGMNSISSKTSSLESTGKRIQNSWRHIRRDGWTVSRGKPHKTPRLERDYDLWTEIRRVYWSSQLTHHSDTLVAISGVTNALEQRTGLHFLFGLCKEFLCSELLWQVQSANETSRSTLGPTWSWASVEKANLKSVYRFIDHSTTSTFHTWVDFIDGLKSTKPSPHWNALHLRGPLLHASLKRDKYGCLKVDNDRLPKYGYNLDIPLPDTVDVVFLAVVEWTVDYESDPYNERPGQAGLVLVPSLHGDSMYERVGVWNEATYTELSDLKITQKDIQSFWLV
ncbi:MAG: hypothetical protein Q9180_003110 [Flavoplaca navasiana]